MFSPSEIREIRFEEVKRGYNPTDVRAFMSQVADEVETLEREKQDLESKMQVLADKIEEYRKDEDSLKVALLGAQRMGDGILQESRQKADILIRDANLKAEKIVSSSTQKLEREELALKKMQREVAKFKSDVLAIYKTHLEGLSALPDADDVEMPNEVKPPAKAESAAEPAKDSSAFTPEIPKRADAPLDLPAAPVSAPIAVESTTNKIPELPKQDEAPKTPLAPNLIKEDVPVEQKESPFAVFGSTNKADPLQDPKEQSGVAAAASSVVAAAGNVVDKAGDVVEKVADKVESVVGKPEEKADDTDKKDGGSKFGKLDFGDGFSFNG